MEPVQKKGMSKGCLVGIIVVAALIVIMIIAGATCWYYKDSLMKMAGTAAINEVRAKVTENPPAGVDTTYFNAVTDGFNSRLNEEPKINLEKYQRFLVAVQYVAKQKDLDSILVDSAISAMETYFPDLRDLKPESADTLMMNDTTMPMMEPADSE